MDATLSRMGPKTVYLLKTRKRKTHNPRIRYPPWQYEKNDESVSDWKEYEKNG